MFCQECGNPLNEGDKSCKICGTPVRDEPDVPNFKIDSENEVESNTLNWNLNGFPKPKKTEDIDFDWNIDAKTFGKRTTVENRNSTESSPGPSSDSDSHNTDLAEELNRFFNFEKANEDFQKLLDKEYESMQDRLLPRQSQIDMGRMNLGDRISSSEDVVVPAIIADQGEAGPEAAPPDLLKGEAAVVNETESKEGDSDPNEEDVILTDNPDENRGEYQIQDQNDSRTEYQDEHQKGNQDEHQKKHQSEYQNEYHSEDQIEEEPTVIWVDEENTGIHNTGTAEADTGIAEAAGLAADGKTGKIEKLQSDKSGEIPAALWFETDEKDQDSKKKFNIGRAVLILIIVVLLAEAAILGVQYFLPNTNAAKKAEQINDSISGALNGVKDRTVGLFQSVGGKGDVDQTGTGDPDQNVDAEGDDPLDEDASGNDTDHVGEPNLVPSEDKDVLIAAVMAEYNSNIESIEANDKLAWKMGKDYVISDIKNSEPIDNNYWYTTPKGEHVYYDKEIVATLIQFDSQWVDYVNGGSKLVIELTKEGSKARKNAETFSKVGKVKQTFDRLEIGEIRKGQEAFYVWTYEEIKEVQGNKTTIKKYNWVYRLEPIDKEMKIVNYYKY